MGSPLILLLCLFSIFIQLTSAYPVSLPNKTELALGWKFSKHHPYHYFPSVHEIPHNYLPIQVTSIPDRQGIWVLRHKEFSGASEVYSSSISEASESTAIIKFGSSAQLFENVTIKLLTYGTTEFQVKLPDNMEQSISILEPDHLKKCSGNGEDRNGPPKWMTFKIKTPPTSHLVLEAAIHHTHAFLIIDEVIVDYGEGVPRDHHGENLKFSKDIAVACAINLAN